MRVLKWNDLKLKLKAMVARRHIELKSTYQYLLQVKMQIVLQGSNVLRNIHLLGF
jgi:hypothetical protein